MLPRPSWPKRLEIAAPLKNGPWMVCVTARYLSVTARYLSVTARYLSVTARYLSVTAGGEQGTPLRGEVGIPYVTSHQGFGRKS
jgi:hypothetical protein